MTHRILHRYGRDLLQQMQEPSAELSDIGEWTQDLEYLRSHVIHWVHKRYEEFALGVSLDVVGETW